MDLPDRLDLGEETWIHVGETGFSAANTEYEPSEMIFQRCCRFATDQTEVSLSENYNADFIVQSAWKSLPNREIEMPWESGFWDKFLDPSISAFDMLSRGVKRPMPFHAEALQPENKEDPVDKRVLARQTLEVGGFLQYVKDVPERTWREEREEIWETAIRRWILFIEQW